MKVFTCGLCQNIYFTESIFHRHVKTHRPDHDIKCDECGKAFMLRGDLNRHMKRHRQQLDYDCKVCGQQFVRKYHLQRHIDFKHTKTFRPEDLCKNECGRRHSKHVYPFCTPCASVLEVKRMRRIREVASVEACRCFDYLNQKFGLDIVHIHFDWRDRTIVSGHERDDYVSGLKIRADGYEKSNPTHVWEYLGRRWHGEPGTEAYIQTMARLELLADHGYIVHFIWSDEWKRSHGLKSVHVLSRHLHD